MAKNQKKSRDEQEKAAMEKMQKRVESLLPDKANIPASISIQQAEELKVRVRELETQLAQQIEEAQKKTAPVAENITPDQPENEVKKTSRLKLSRSTNKSATGKAKKQSTSIQNKTSPVAFWGTIILSAILLLVFAGVLLLTIMALSAVPDSGAATASTFIAFEVAIAMAVIVITSVASLIFAIRGSQALGYGLAYLSIAMFVLNTSTLVGGQALSMSFLLLILSTFGIGWLSPTSSRRFYITATIIIFALIWVIEWINPPWQADYSGTQLGPIGTVVFVFIFAGLLLRQAWSGNIRLKVITSFTIVALISTSIVGAVVYVSYRNQMREDIRQRLLNIISLVAMNQDGDAHASIHGPENAKDESHLKILAQNIEYLATDPDLKYIYTMRKNEQGQIYFVINARQGGEPGDPIGTIYNEPSDLLRTQFDTLSEPVIEEDLYTDVYGQVLASYAPFYRSDGTLEGIIGVDMDAEKVLAQERTVLILIIETTFAAMVIVTLIGLFLGNLFVQPIVRLSSVAQKITSGEFNARAKVETTDEVGDLATALNTMTSQLQETLQGLEQRVADRTHDLELAAEVGSTIAEKVDNLTAMLTDATEMIRSKFNLYYTQVYLLDPSGQTITLRAGTGSVGQQLLRRGHHLLVSSSSLNGRAVSEKKPVIVADTQKSGTFLPNPLLPNTRSEMAIPLLVGDKVLGVLDMQSEIPDALSEENLAAFQVLAGQLSVAIQNATLFGQSEEARKQVEANVRQITITGWQDFLNGNDRGEKIGYVFDQTEVKPMERKSKARSENVLSMPITVTGAAVGAIEVAQDEREWTSSEAQIIQSTAEKLSQHIEGLRLLAQAEKYRQEAEQNTRRLTREGWQNFVQTHDTLASGYSFNPNEVKSETEEAEVELSSALSLPLTVRDETVGELFIQGLESEDSESISLANAVIERLGSHIESLRLSMQTEQALATTQEFAKREQSLRQITSAVRGSTDPATILRTAVRELGTLLGRKTVVRLTTEKTGQTEHPTDLVSEAATDTKNETVSPAELPNADGGNK
jgi:GAF domain-containing protein